MKLSPYQIKVVQALMKGKHLYSLSGLHGHCWIEGVKPNPSFKTAHVLEKNGMLATIKDDWGGSIWKWSGKKEAL